MADASKSSTFTTLPEISGRTFAENRLAFAFLTNIPITPGHTLVAPKRVVTTYDQLTPQELLAIFELATIVRTKLRNNFSAEGFNCAWNEGERYGQSVPHFHLHIVPRTPGDAGITNYEPREFLYRPGSRDMTPEAKLTSIAELLRSKSI
jgi:diadenosine tetraphosphate (Ap4A) HIT family hydrolase